jgi:predicted MFS family arabinose efflux permease
MHDGIMQKVERVPNRVWALTAAVTIVGAQALVPGTLLKDISTSVGASPGLVGAVFGGYGLALACTSLCTAVLGRITARTRVVGGLVALGVALLLVASASTLLVLLFGVLLAGIAAGVVLPAVYALVPTLVAPELLGRAMSRTLLGWALSFVIGIPMAGVVAEWAGWRGALVLLAVVAVVTALLAVTLPNSGGHGATVAGLRHALRDRSIVLLLGGIAAFMAAFYGVFAVEGTAARNSLEEGAWLPSAIALAFGLGFSVASALQRWVERLERVLLPVAFLLLVGVYALLPVANDHLVSVLLIAVIWGFINESALTALVTRITRHRDAAAALALYNTVTYFAAAAGTAIAGTTLATVGFPAVGAGAAATCFVGLVAVLLAHRGRPGHIGQEALSGRSAGEERVG